jgi:hypothetical protein
MSNVVVIGYCASGKSSVVETLRKRGVDAEAVAQEHSVIRDLWDHHQPDTLIFLDVTLEQIRARRHNPRWPEWIYQLQTERLSGARIRADLVVDTTTANLDEVTQQVLAFLGVNG